MGRRGGSVVVNENKVMNGGYYALNSLPRRGKKINLSIDPKYDFYCLLLPCGGKQFIKRSLL